MSIETYRKPLSWPPVLHLGSLFTAFGSSYSCVYITFTSAAVRCSENISIIRATLTNLRSYQSPSQSELATAVPFCFFCCCFFLFFFFWKSKIYAWSTSHRLSSASSSVHLLFLRSFLSNSLVSKYIYIYKLILNNYLSHLWTDSLNTQKHKPESWRMLHSKAQFLRISIIFFSLSLLSVMAIPLEILNPKSVVCQSSTLVLYLNQYFCLSPSVLLTRVTILCGL